MINNDTVFDALGSDCLDLHKFGDLARLDLHVGLTVRGGSWRRRQDSDLLDGRPVGSLNCSQPFSHPSFTSGCRRAAARPGAGAGVPARCAARYRAYLAQERGLAERTTARYLRVARRFLTACSPDGEVTADSVTAAAALGFLTAQCAGKSAGWAGCASVAVRSLLRFLHLEELIAGPWAQAVPMPARWRLAALPKTVGQGRAGGAAGQL